MQAREDHCGRRLQAELTVKEAYELGVLLAQHDVYQQPFSRKKVLEQLERVQRQIASRSVDLGRALPPFAIAEASNLDLQAEASLSEPSSRKLHAYRGTAQISHRDRADSSPERNARSSRRASMSLLPRAAALPPPSSFLGLRQRSSSGEVDSPGAVAGSAASPALSARDGALSASPSPHGRVGARAAGALGGAAYDDADADADADDAAAGALEEESLIASDCQ